MEPASSPPCDQDHHKRVRRVQKLLKERNGRSYSYDEAKEILAGLSRIIQLLVDIDDPMSQSKTSQQLPALTDLLDGVTPKDVGGDLSRDPDRGREQL